jgi:Asp-tRNA(Asn)/Glu-tRNA(Gln) amidotransferase A subunit family amidase
MTAPLTERSALKLARAIRQRELTAGEVVEAHIALHQRTAIRVNALAAERFELARQKATAADELLRAAAPAAELPPLLGVPFTVKESLRWPGCRRRPACWLASITEPREAPRRCSGSSTRARSHWGSPTPLS